MGKFFGQYFDEFRAQTDVEFVYPIWRVIGYCDYNECHLGKNYRGHVAGNILIVKENTWSFDNGKCIMGKFKKVKDPFDYKKYVNEYIEIISKELKNCDADDPKRRHFETGLRKVYTVQNNLNLVTKTLTNLKKENVS